MRRVLAFIGPLASCKLSAEGGSFRIKIFHPFARVVYVHQLRGGHLPKVWVPQVNGSIGVSPAFRFDNEVGQSGTSPPHRTKVEGLQHIEDLGDEDPA